MISLAILTIGVDIMLVTELTRRIGSDILNVPPPVGRRRRAARQRRHHQQPRDRHGRRRACSSRLFFLAFKFSDWGVAMRANAEDGETAALMGIRPGRVVGARLGRRRAASPPSPACSSSAPRRPGVAPGIQAVALRAFPAAILGGLDSTGGALVGGIIIGLAESFAAGYQDQLLFLGRGFGDVVPYVVMILVLLVRPSGLFGTRELTRV